MCPIWPLHLIVIYLLALCPLWMVCQALPNLTATFNPTELTAYMDEYNFVNLTITGTSGLQPGDYFKLVYKDLSDSEYVAPAWNSTNQLTEDNVANDKFDARVSIHAKFIGKANVRVVGVNNATGTTHDVTNGSLSIIVVRPQRIIDTVFTSSVVTFVSLIFINFGCAMHWPTVKTVLKRPIGPAIGILGHFLFMPLISFGLGYLIFPDSGGLRLGMFFTGVAPAGGASNIWTFILGGNLNLSIAMTTISTICSIGLMPAWLFSLGQVVFANAKIRVPYKRIIEFVLGLIIPLGIGLVMQRWTPRLAAFMVKILKGFSTVLLLFIIILAIVTNLYIFQLFSWKIILAGMGIPWLGYSAGYLLAWLFRQPHRDALAISIETGIQNTGIAIYLLKNALEQPNADITTVIPVSVAIMTPIPMMAIFIYQQINTCVVNRRKHKKMLHEDTNGGETTDPTIVSPADLLDGKGPQGVEARTGDAATIDVNVGENGDVGDCNTAGRVPIAVIS